MSPKDLKVASPKKIHRQFDALKEEINNQIASKNPYLPKKNRPFVGAGAQCVALEDGHKKILLVAPLRAAEGIELVKKTFSTLSTAEAQEFPFEIPTLITQNIPMSELMNLETEKSYKHAKNTYLANVSSKILNGTENVIYELTRYDGTLEDFRKNVRFKSDSIVQIEDAISKALAIFHKHNLSHGDVALRNIFYTGKYPHFKFYLGDFGSVKTLSSEIHDCREIQKDLSDLQYAIKQLQEKLKSKTPSPDKRRALLYQFDDQKKTCSVKYYHHFQERNDPNKRQVKRISFLSN